MQRNVRKVLACSVVLGLLQLSLAVQTISPLDPSIRYLGRTQQPSNSALVQFDWPGIEIHVTIYAQSVSALLKDNGSTFNVFVDGKFVQILNTTSSQSTYVVADGLDTSQPHYLHMTKRTEPLVAVTTFGGFVLKGGAETVSPPPELKPTRKIEWIGDSITCGYGDEGTSPSCPFSPATENNLYTYGPVVSTHFGYEWHVEAWSGLGVVRNYGDKNITSKNPTLPVRFPRAVANDASSQWNFANWIPDMVVINLGTNDYSTQPSPPQDIFVTGYKNFVKYIDSQYTAAGSPGIEYHLVCGPMIRNPCCAYVQQVVSELQGDGFDISYIDMQGILSYPSDFGCSGHPNVVGHQKMAKVVIDALSFSMK